MKAPVCSFIPLLQAPPGGRAPGMGEGKVAEGMEGRGGWKSRREGCSRRSWAVQKQKGPTPALLRILFPS